MKKQRYNILVIVTAIVLLSACATPDTSGLTKFDSVPLPQSANQDKFYSVILLEVTDEQGYTEYRRLNEPVFYDGRLTQPVMEQFTGIVKEARSQFVNERINERLKSALSNVESESTSTVVSELSDSSSVIEPASGKDGIVTTPEEIEGYNIVKAILREIVDVKRVAMRDTKSYCGILLDNNNRKPICRLHFNYSQKYLGVFDGKNESKLEIDSVDDIFKYAHKIKSTLNEYEVEPA